LSCTVVSRQVSCLSANRDYEGTEHDARPELEDLFLNINLLSLK